MSSHPVEKRCRRARWKPVEAQGQSGAEGLLRVFEFLLAAEVPMFVDEAAGLSQVGLRRYPRIPLCPILHSSSCLLHSPRGPVARHSSFFILHSAFTPGWLGSRIDAVLGWLRMALRWLGRSPRRLWQ